VSDGSAIEWTDATWNPVRGCKKISPGCKNCYAETFAERWRGVPGHPYEQGFDVRLVPGKLDEPLRWKRPRKIFVNSMSDLFQEDVPFDYVDRVWAAMLLSPHHTHQVLTKRADLMHAYLSCEPDRLFPSTSLRYTRVLEASREFRAARPRLLSIGISDPVHHPAPWIWLGVSVEDRKYGLPRIDHLRETPAAIRFLSIEPLLEDLGEIDLRGISWVIVGGESGAGARPMRVEWVRSIRDQCEAAGVPFFFKQWGGILKKKHGRELDGRTHDAFPEVRRG
jgi:protein gp37